MVERYLVSDELLEEYIHQYCQDFTALARKGRYDPITGRDKEIEETIMILLQKGRKNVALQAPAGVGKTALVVGLAQQVIADNVPEYLKNCRILEVELPRMASGTNSIAEFQERFLGLCKGVAERYYDENYSKYILFLDEFHTIMPTCHGSSYAGLSEVMKPYLTAGALHVIGATTLDEFRIYISVDPAMDRRFQQVHLSVPNAVETVSILQNLRPGLEKHHKIKIPDDCLELVVKLTDEHLPRRNQPDKGIVMLDGACAYHVMNNGYGGDLTAYDIKRIVSIECKIHPDAL